MSKFFDALEQAEHERLEEKIRQQQSRQPADDEGVPPRVSRSAAARKAVPARDFSSDAAVKVSPREKITAPKLDRGPREVSLGRIDDHLVSLLDSASPEAEQYRTLGCAVEQAHKDSGLRILAITSAGGGDGKTLTAINLAAILAQTSGNRVLLIDADLRHPSVEAQLGMSHSEAPGLIDAINNPDVTLGDVARTLSAFNLSIVTAGQVFDSPYEAIKSPRMEELIENARREYDYVVVDTPPIVPVPDCRIIARWVEGFLIVVAAHQTPRKLLEEALNIVDPAKVIGLVFNGDDVPLSRYYNYSYASGRSHNGNVGSWSDRLGHKSAAFSRTSVPLPRR
jgi:capsular exopolysaccharide synthesis family protein